jgi:hypothetical protein
MVAHDLEQASMIKRSIKSVLGKFGYTICKTDTIARLQNGALQPSSYGGEGRPEEEALRTRKGALEAALSLLQGDRQMQCARSAGA